MFSLDFEKMYSLLPDFIKYNKYVLNFFLSFSKKLIKLTNNSNTPESEEFLKLVTSDSNFQANGVLRDVQLFYLELMRFIDNVCNKYGIDYWITGGTLLGAVRHGGFIPWDDDIDISLMREDYDKLIEVLPKEVSKYNYFKKECGLSLLRENHENYYKDFKGVYSCKGDDEILGRGRFMFLQLAWLTPYIKIDIFPEDYVIEDKLDHFTKNYISTKYKFNQEVKDGKKKFDKEFALKNEYLGFTKTKTKYFNDGLDSLQLYPASIRETNKTFPLSKIKFDKYVFKCPNDVDDYLTRLFGSNYMQLPDSIETHDIAKLIESQFNSKDEMIDKFKKDIKYLKEINENFE